MSVTGPLFGSVLTPLSVSPLSWPIVALTLHWEYLTASTDTRYPRIKAVNMAVPNSPSSALDGHIFTLSYLRQVIQNLDVLPNLPKIPVRPLFQTRDPGYEIRRAELSSAASRLGSELSLLSAAIEEIQELVRSVQNSLEATKNACATVHMLLPELLGEIFTLAVHDHDAPTDLRQAFAFSQVCSSWRAVAMDQGQIWTRVNLSPLLDPQRQDYLEWWCARARNYPLHVTFGPASFFRQYRYCAEVHVALVAGLERLGKWAGQIHSVYVEEENVDRALKDSGAFPTKFSSLKSIQLRSSTHESANADRRNWGRWDAPTLEEVAIFRGSSDQYPIGRFLDGLLSSRVKRLTFRDYSITGRDMLGSLMACPNLVELSLEDLSLRYSGPDPSSRFPMQSLEVLNLRAWNPQYGASVLVNCFTFPSLRQVTFQGEKFHDTRSIRLLVSDVRLIHPLENHH